MNILSISLGIFSYIMFGMASLGIYMMNLRFDKLDMPKLSKRILIIIGWPVLALLSIPKYFKFMFDDLFGDLYKK